MPTSNRGCQYDEYFKRTIVNLYTSSSKTQTALCQEYDISLTSLTLWFKQYLTVETDDGKVLTAKQVKDFQKINFQLEENLMIPKTIVIFTQHSNND